MWRTLLLCGAVLALVFVTSCKVNVEGAGGEPADPGGADMAEAGDAMGAPAETGVEVVAFAIGDERDDDGAITNETTELTPDTSVMYVVAGITGLETGAKITGTLNAIKVTTADGQTVEDHEVSSTDIEAPGEESTARFDFSAPDAGWPIGDYQVVITVDDEVVKTVDLTCGGGSM